MGRTKLRVISVYLDDARYDMVKRAAALEHRTMSNFLGMVGVEAAEERGMRPFGLKPKSGSADNGASDNGTHKNKNPAKKRARKSTSPKARRKTRSKGTREKKA